jgi:arsenate reductase
MATPKLFHYPGCSTCKKARKWLDAHGIAVEAIDIVEHPPSRRQLETALRLSGLPVRKLFNTSGQSYREGGWRDRLPASTQAQALAALAADGKLIKRPLLLGDGFALVGFRESEYAERLRA